MESPLVLGIHHFWMGFKPIFEYCHFFDHLWANFPLARTLTQKSFPERHFTVYNAEHFFVTSYNPMAWVVKKAKLNSKKV